MSTTQTESDDRNDRTTAAETDEAIDPAWTEYGHGGRTKLAVENLNVHYGDEGAIDDVSLDVPEESVTALIRPVGVWQVDVPPVSESDERPDQECEGRRVGQARRRGDLRR